MFVVGMGLFSAVILLLGVYGFLIEPNRLEIKHLHLESVTAFSRLRGTVAVHLSDLHIVKIGPREERLLSTVSEIDPDLIFLTGDYVTFRGNYEIAFEFLTRLHARNGVWAVMGDYDYSRPRKSCLFCHEEGVALPTDRHGVHFFNGETVALDLGKGEIIVGGEDHFNKFDSRLRYPLIVLSHSPLAFDHFSENREMLILAGDTHGGQVPAPTWLWRLLGYDKNARYNHGYFVQKKKRMYVSRGIGTSHLPFRLGRRPEIVVLHF